MENESKDKNVKKQKNNKPFTGSLIIYPLGALLSIMYTRFLSVCGVPIKLLMFVLSKSLIILALNCYLSYIDPISSFTNEKTQYEAVENNARVLLTTSLAFAMFIRFTGIKGTNTLRQIMTPVIMSFVFSSLILTIVWMPKGSEDSGEFVRGLRDIKTIFLTSSLSCLLIAMYVIAKQFI